MSQCNQQIGTQENKISLETYWKNHYIRAIQCHISYILEQKKLNNSYQFKAEKFKGNFSISNKISFYDKMIKCNLQKNFS